MYLAKGFSRVVDLSGLAHWRMYRPMPPDLLRHSMDAPPSTLLGNQPKK
jgi:hypothetical protein